METWTVLIFVNSSGSVAFDKWKESNKLTVKDRAALDAKVDTIQQTEGRLPHETLKKYKGTSFYEMKVRGDKKQLRPLCTVDEDRKIIILCGAIEKGGKIPTGDLQTAANLLAMFKKGQGSVKDYN